jgi:alginate O-acetyltransferase complex protein AlgI
MLKWLRNILIVWALTGFWHGAAGNFIVWGLYFACFLVLEKFLLRKKLEQSRIFSHIYVMLFVIISFVIFDATSLAEALKNIGGMFGFAGVPLISQECMYYAKSYGILLIIAIIGTTPFPKKMLEKLRENIIAESILNICEPIVLVGLLLVMTGYLVDGSFNPFLYFRF